MKFGYVELANWQEYVGDEDIGLDFTKIDFNSDPDAAIKEILAQDDKSKKWRKIVEAEMDILQKDLCDLGL